MKLVLKLVIKDFFYVVLGFNFNVEGSMFCVIVCLFVGLEVFVMLGFIFCVVVEMRM